MLLDKSLHVRRLPVYLVSDLGKENKGHDHKQVVHDADRSSDDADDLESKVTR